MELSCSGTSWDLLPGPEQAKFNWSGRSMCTMRAMRASARMVVGGSCGHAPQEILDVLGSILVHFWDTCLSWQGTCYKLTIVYACEKDCKYSTIINSDRHIIEICSCKSLRYTCCAGLSASVNGARSHTRTAAQDSKPLDDTTDDLLSLARCSESPRYYCTTTFSAMP